MKALIIGDSHTACISQALEGHGKPAAVYRLQSNSRASIKGAISIADAISIIKDGGHSTSVFFSILGTYHNIIGLLRHSVDYDFGVENIAQDPEIYQIPYRVIASVFAQHFDRAGTLLKLCEATAGKAYLICPPPPQARQHFCDE